MPRTVKTRKYDSSRRREQAGQTRRAILEAARSLFVESGYAATTINAIATQAGVSPESVYAVFGSKRALLSELIDVSIVGDDASIPVLERDWVEKLSKKTDPRAALELLARNGRIMLQRWTPIYEVLRGAAASDPEIASLWQENKNQRFSGQHRLVHLVAKIAGLRKGLTVSTAADIVFAVGSPETYRLLVVDRGWSAQRFERWYADTLIRLLLA